MLALERSDELQQELLLQPGCDSQRALPANDKVKMMAMVKSIWIMTKPLLLDHESGKRTRTLLVLMSVLIIVDNLIHLWFNYVHSDYTTAMHKQDIQAFHSGLAKYFAGILAILPIIGAKQYTEGWLGLEWRRYLMKALLGHYLSDVTFYRLTLTDSIDNPDQRICQDTYDFVTNCISLSIAFVDSGINLVCFISVLMSISPMLCFFLLSYALLGTIVSLSMFGKRLLALRQRILAQEATMRFGLVRVRENAESIAFYRGQGFEKELCEKSFKSLMETLYDKLRVSVGFHCFTNSYRMLTFVLPTLLVAPMYFDGEVQFGVITQTIFAFHHILNSLTVIVTNLEKISDLGAQAFRLHTLQAAFEKEAKHAEHKRRGLVSNDAIIELIEFNTQEVSPTHPVLHVENLTVDIPSAKIPRPLMEDLSFSLYPGNSLLVIGDSGVGKSSFLRAISGLWSDGQGTVKRCAVMECFFIPQYPYMCVGTLQQQVLYPYVQDSTISNDQVIAALKKAQLGNLTDRYRIDEEVGWAHTLSIGEQQRMGFARLFLRKRISLALLDESTSALDQENEERMYQTLQKHVPTFISIGHRSTIRRFHSHQLVLNSSPGGESSGNTRGSFGPLEDRVTAKTIS